MRNLRLIAAVPLLLFSCVEAMKGPGMGPTARPPPKIKADSQLACEDHGPTPHKWTASFDTKRVERCKFHGRDSTLELKLQGGDMDLLDIFITEFTGSGGYQTGGNAKSTRVNVIAKGGAEGTTATRVGTETEACAASCNIEVPEAKVTTVDVGAKGTITLEVSCPSLAGPGPGCISCKVDTPAFAKITIPACDRAD